MTAVYNMVSGSWEENPTADTAEARDIPPSRHPACRLQLLEHSAAPTDPNALPPLLLIDIDQLLG